MHKPPANAIEQQLALSISQKSGTSIADFCWGNNELLKDKIDDILSLTPQNHYLYIWGVSASGKSHLLQACCQAESKSSAIYLPLKTFAPYGPKALEGIDKTGLICIDDIDVIAGDKAWEEAIFHLYNQVRDNQIGRLIISSHNSPTKIKINLPDLLSRLRFGLAIFVLPLTDEDKINTIIKHAKLKGLILSSQVANFLINRSSRNMHDLHNILEQLDTASLSAQRKLTIPFIKGVLAL